MLAALELPKLMAVMPLRRLQHVHQMYVHGACMVKQHNSEVHAIIPAAANIRQVASEGARNKVQHSKNGGQVGSLCD